MDGATATPSLVPLGHDKSGGEGITGSMLGAAVGIGSAGGWAVLVGALVSVVVGW